MHERMKVDITQLSPNEDREKANACPCAELEEVVKEHAHQLEEIGKERTSHCVELEDMEKERAHYCAELEDIEKERICHRFELKRERQLFELQLRDYRQALIVSWIIFVACVVAYYFKIVHDKYDRLKLP